MSGPPARGAPAVVFDYDGTLLDSKRVKIENYLRSFREIFRPPEHLQGLIEQSCLRTLGASRAAQLEDTLRSAGLEASPQQREAWDRLYSTINRRTVPGARLFPSARPLLRRLRRAGFRLFVASGMPEEELHQELGERGLLEFFVDIRGGDKAEILRGILGRGHQRVTFVGDTAFDERTAVSAGVDFFLIERDEDLRRLGPLLVPHGGA